WRGWSSGRLISGEVGVVGRVIIVVVERLISGEVGVVERLISGEVGVVED
ncbi:hypothetical protein LINPERPRIM_LOCUS13758, partial [Linum perenne]